MPAKKPTDTSLAWWSKNRAMTLKTGKFDTALKAFEVAKKNAVAGKPTPMKGVLAAIQAGNALLLERTATEKACKKGIHDETREILVAYKPLMAAEIATLQKQETALKTRIAAMDKQMQAIGAKINEIKVQGETIVKSLQKLQKEAESKMNEGNADKWKKLADQLFGRFKDIKSKDKMITAAVDKVYASSQVDQRDFMQFTSIKDISKLTNLSMPLLNFEDSLNLAYKNFEKDYNRVMEDADF